MPLSKEGLPVTGRGWMAPLERLLRFVLSWLTGGSQFITSDLVTFKPLPANTYANGTSGVGATLTGNANGALAVDGVAASPGMVVGVWGESAGANNGLYVVTNAGSSSAAYVLTRSPLFNASALIVPGTRIGVRSGSVYAGVSYEYTGAGAPTVGTTALGAIVTTKMSRDVGVIPGSRIPLGANPTNGDTLTIGGKSFQFVTNLGAAGAAVQIKILGSLALTLAALLNAINGVTSDANWVEATVPFAISVVADNPTGNTLRLRGARARGGDPVAAVMASTALASSLTSAASWTNDNLSQIGKADSDTLQSTVIVTMTAAMVAAMATAGGLIVELPFTPTIVSWMVKSSAKVFKSTISDTIEPIAGGAQLLQAGATHIAATDIVIVYAQQ